MLTALTVLFGIFGLAGLAGLGIAAKRYPHVTRSGTLFVAGLLGVLHETLVTKGTRLGLLTLFGGMMGLGSPLRKDKEKQLDAEGGA